MGVGERMSEKKSYQVWTISEKFRKAAKEKISKKNGIQQRNIRIAQVKDANLCQQEKL